MCLYNTLLFVVRQRLNTSVRTTFSNTISTIAPTELASYTTESKSTTESISTTLSTTETTNKDIIVNSRSPIVYLTRSYAYGDGVLATFPQCTLNLGDLPVAPETLTLTLKFNTDIVKHIKVCVGYHFSILLTSCVRQLVCVLLINIA